MIYLGTDHRGFKLKEKIKEWLSEWGHEFEDLGNTVYDKGDDYPDFASAVARKVTENPRENRGILLCGSGVGMDIAANKFKGVRSALVWSDDEELVKHSRLDDGTNVLSSLLNILPRSKLRTLSSFGLRLPILVNLDICAAFKRSQI